MATATEFGQGHWQCSYCSFDNDLTSQSCWYCKLQKKTNQDLQVNYSVVNHNGVEFDLGGIPDLLREVGVTFNPPAASCSINENHSLPVSVNNHIPGTGNGSCPTDRNTHSSLSFDENGPRRVRGSNFTAVQSKWRCTDCTLINEYCQLSCLLCGKIKLKENYVNNPSTSCTAPNAIAATNVECFECPLCYLLYSENDGIALRNCNHKFCRNCLKEAVHYSSEARLRCPLKVKGVLCENFLTDEEILTILTWENVNVDSRSTIHDPTAPVGIIEVIEIFDVDDDVSVPQNNYHVEVPNVTDKGLDYNELLELEKNVLITNVESFECTICMTDCNSGEGVIVRDCLHHFCRECLTQAIKCNTEAEMRCPFGDGTYRCDSVLQDREIRALVDAEVFEKHLKRSVTEAENKMKNTFHCKTADCVGWCIYEEDVNNFYCPVCDKNNCINCKTIHTGLNCKQYQEKIKREAECNQENAKTENMLQKMLRDKKAMSCPTCQIILTKMVGCDWLRCTMCKTEICWVTRGPRWGPKGNGDTSGGCRCRVNGKLCHPQCGNCH